MKKAAALIITICLVLVAAAPVVVKAASDDLYYITYQANLGKQELVDRGIVQNTANGSVSYFMVNSQIQSYNDLELPVDLSEWDYYMITGSNTWQGENFSGFSGVAVIVYNSDSPLLCYKASPSLSQFYFDNAAYKNGTYSWDRGSFVFYGEDIHEMSQNGDFKIYNMSGSSWEESTYAFYNNLSIAVNGSFIASTNQPLLYAGEDIAKNSTVTVSNGYDLNEVKQWLADGVNNSESIIDYFQVTKDGINYDSWGDAFGTDIELEHDSRLTFSWCDCYPVKNTQFGALVDAQPRWNVDTGSFDFTFDGDNIKAGKAANKWGIGFDIECHYKIQGNDGSAVNGSPVAGQTYDGVVYCHLDYDNLNEQQFYNGIYDISLLDVLQNGNSFQGGDAGAVLLASLALDPAVKEQMQTYILYNDERTMTAEQLRQGLGDGAAWFPQGQLPVDYFPANMVYSLTECVYEITFYPFNSGLGIKGQTSRMFSNTFTGEHGGTATGAVIPNSDPTALPDIRPDNSTGTNTNYIYPINPGGGASDYAIAQGSPSNSSASATGGEGGNAVVNVQANPIITFDNGLDTFMQVMNLSKNAETVQKGFWGFFGMFKDNPASELYREYFGDIPEDFMKFLLACSGICFGLGVFRFVRGRYL